MLPQQRIREVIAFVSLIAITAIFFTYSYVNRKTPSLIGEIYTDASEPTDQRVADLLSRMTLREKIGQMALVEKNSLARTSDISKYGIGALLSGGGSQPEDRSKTGWKRMVEAYVDESRASRLTIPILYGVDANHGQGNVQEATIFPHAIGLGSTGNSTLVQRIGEVVAQESNALGITWIFSPSLDLPKDIRWGRVYEAFSDDPAIAGRLGAAEVRGLQDNFRTDQLGRINVLATPKHFVGAGSMQWGSSLSDTPEYRLDQGVTLPDEELLRRVYVPPFKDVIASGAQSIMVGLNSWGDTKLSGSTYLITDVLKKDLHFAGFVVSDWYGVYEITPTDDKYHSAVLGINAGVDMVMLPFDYQEFIDDVEEAVRRGDISEDRINDAVRRILTVKFNLGLFDTQKAQASLEVVGSEEHRALARIAVQKSLVLLKNENNILPLKRNLRKIRVAGSAADNVGQQSGAWTVNWQGIDGNALPGATSILKSITEAVSSTTVVQYEKNGRFAEKDIADIGIAIVGEKPYAEGFGDNPYPQLSKEDLETIEHIRSSSARTIVVLISGRPLFITNQIPQWDAVVEAWLPGSEGEGVADVIFGKVGFSGTLPLPWPRTLQQLPLKGDQTNDGTEVLFKRGYGLTTKAQ